MHEAVDLLEARLRQRLERVTDHARSESIRHRGDEWHHGDPAAHRPPYFDRPAEDREIIRHKSFAVGATSPEEAVLDMELLDHDLRQYWADGRRPGRGRRCRSVVRRAPPS
jgi:hypothetical protein